MCIIVSGLESIWDDDSFRTLIIIMMMMMMIIIIIIIFMFVLFLVLSRTSLPVVLLFPDIYIMEHFQITFISFRSVFVSVTTESLSCCISINRRTEDGREVRQKDGRNSFDPCNWNRPTA
jgi:magnesium-transporting ATPase (P-type)